MSDPIPFADLDYLRERERRATAIAAPPVEREFQARVQPWMMACFGPEISADIVERNHRFLEESLELVQSTGCTASEAHQLVDYVYGRPVGVPSQEAGGVMVTLAALCLAQGLDMHMCGVVELARIWLSVEKIRAKQAAKPKHSPLPEASPPIPAGQEVLTKDEIAVILEALETDHDGRDFEPECPGCTAYRKLAAMQTIPKLAPATTKEKPNGAQEN